MRLSQMKKKIYLLFHASDSRHLQHLLTDKFFELINLKVYSVNSNGMIY